MWLFASIADDSVFAGDFTFVHNVDIGNQVGCDWDAV